MAKGNSADWMASKKSLFRKPLKDARGNGRRNHGIAAFFAAGRMGVCLDWSVVPTTLDRSFGRGMASRLDGITEVIRTVDGSRSRTIG